MQEKEKEEEGEVGVREEQGGEGEGGNVEEGGMAKADARECVYTLF